MNVYELGYSTSEKALEAYEAQSKIVEENFQLFGNPDTLKDLSICQRAGEIYSGNLRRLNAIAEVYACLRIRELCVREVSHV